MNKAHKKFGNDSLFLDGKTDWSFGNNSFVVEGFVKLNKPLSKDEWIHVKIDRGSNGQTVFVHTQKKIKGVWYQLMYRNGKLTSKLSLDKIKGEEK